MAEPRVIVVGGGLAGLMTTIKIAETGVPVDLFSVVPVKRSHSVCAQGGINAAVNWKGEGDSPARHFEDTVYGGDFLADQPPVQAMCEAGPAIIFLLDRMGVTFNRTAEGLLDFRRFGGTLFNRTAFAGATTGQQLLYALDEQVRRHEVAGRVRRFERHEFVGIVKDDGGRCRGIVAMDLASMKLDTFPATAVALATGGPGVVFGKSTNSVVNTGTAAAAVPVLMIELVDLPKTRPGPPVARQTAVAGKVSRRIDARSMATMPTQRPWSSRTACTNSCRSKR